MQHVRISNLIAYAVFMRLRKVLRIVVQVLISLKRLLSSNHLAYLCESFRICTFSLTGMISLMAKSIHSVYQ